MGQSADQIRREIEEVRGELGQTIDAIGDRVSPRQAVRRRTKRVRNGLTSVREAVMGKADDVGSTVTGAAGSVREGVGGAADTVSDKAAVAAHGVTEGVSTAAETVSTAAETVAGAARRAPGAVTEQTRGNPLAAGAVAFGVGLLAAAAFPATKAEARVADTLTDELEPLKDQAQGVAQEIRGDFTEAARAAAEEVKDRAKASGSAVADQAQAAAEHVQQQATGATGEVAEQAQQSAARTRDEVTNLTDTSTQRGVK